MSRKELESETIIREALNLHRRHLTSGQKAILGLDVEPFYTREAKVRQLSTLKQNTVVEFFPQREQGRARDKAAKAVGTNGRYISDVKRIKQDVLPIDNKNSVPMGTERQTRPQPNIPPISVCFIPSEPV